MSANLSTRSRRCLTLACIGAGVLLAGCTQNEHEHDNERSGNNKPLDVTQQVALVATAGDYSSMSGAHALIATTAPYTAQTNLAPTDTTDLGVACAGDALFRLEKFDRNSITRFSVTAPETVQWQYSTTDNTEDPGFDNSNPYDIISVSDTKAYVIRYGSPLVWIVNPSAATGGDFKIGTLDLSAYADADGRPETTGGVVVDGKLFLIMQRIDRNDGWLPGTAYVAVFDTTSDAEIDTGADQTLKGIPLPVTDPGRIQYQAANDTLYIQAVGKYDDGVRPAYYDGGIVTLDPHDYFTNLLVDDGDADSHPWGNITNMALVSADRGYFVGYAGWGDTTLYAFNPTTGSVAQAPVADLQHVDISDINADAAGKLWVGRRGESGITLIDSAGNQVLEPLINTDLDPIQIVFCGG